MRKTDTLIGKQIDQFRLDQFIARGAMGAVFKAFDAVLARTIALKLIPKEIEEGLSEAEVFTREESKKRLIQEAKAAGRLAHPNIVTIHSYGETDEFQYICMEYVSGKTLTQVLSERKPLCEEEAVSIFVQVLSALEAANKEEIIHRDIKPANIMITEENRVKVMDFGIAKLPSLSMTVTGMVLGTPYYMSPEQIAGKKVDIRSDIFSVGTVLYEVMTGEKPFVGESTATITYKIMALDPTPPAVINRNLSQPMADIILKALAKNPDHRFQTPTEMMLALRALVQRPHAYPDDATLAGTVIGEPDFDQTVRAEIPEAVKSAARIGTQPPSAPHASESASRQRVSLDPRKPAEREPLRKDGTGARVSPSPGPGEEETDIPVLTLAEGPAGKRGAKMKGLGIALLTIVVAVAGFLVYRSLRSPGVPSPRPSIPPPTSRSAPVTTRATQPPPPTPTTAPPTTIPPATSTPPLDQFTPGKDKTTASVEPLLVEAQNQSANNPAEAQKLLEEALRLDPNRFETILTMARLQASRKDYSAAVQYYRDAVRVNGNAPEAYSEMGALQQAQGDYASAIRSYEAGLALRPSHPDELLANVAFCHDKLNNPDQARRYYEQALEINPNNRAALAFLDSLSPATTQPKTPIASPRAPDTDSPSRAVRVEGKYNVEGQNPNGTSYHGTATIKRSVSGYTVTWNVGGKSYTGSGPLVGRTLTVKWRGSRGATGAVVYTVTATGVLKGVWGPNSSGLETLTPIN